MSIEHCYWLLYFELFHSISFMSYIPTLFDLIFWMNFCSTLTHSVPMVLSTTCYCWSLARRNPCKSVQGAHPCIAYPTHQRKPSWSTENLTEAPVMLQLRFSPSHNALDHPNHCWTEVEKGMNFLGPLIVPTGTTKLFVVKINFLVKYLSIQN